MDAAAETERLELPSVRARGPWRRAARRYARRPVGVAALLVLFGIVVAGLLGGRIAPYYENELDLSHVNQASGPTFAGHHWFGTDYLGRDQLSQILYGLHTSMLLGLAVAAAATVIGVLVGAAAGYAGGLADGVLMRGVDLVVTVPVLAIMLVCVAYFSPLTPNRMALVLGLYLWTGVARVVRASVASLRHRDFVEAADAAGASPLRIVARHLLPNSTGTIVAAATTAFGLALTIEATVDFFNIGTSQISVGGPTIGNLLSDATKFGPLAQAPWWTYTFPALVLIVLLTCVNFVGDCLDEALQPQA